MRRKRNKKLTPYERVVWEIIKNSDRELSTREVSEYGNMSWSTAKKSLDKLYRNRKTLHTKKKGKARLWYIK